MKSDYFPVIVFFKIINLNLLFKSMDSTPKPWLQELKAKIGLKFSEHVYHTEDSLYRVLYDRKYRPDIYALKQSTPSASSMSEYQDLSEKCFLQKDKL